MRNYGINDAELSLLTRSNPARLLDLPLIDD